MYVKIHYYVSQHFRQNVDITGVPTRSKDMLTLSLSLYSSGKQLISVFVVWYFFIFLPSALPCEFALQKP